MTSSDLFVLCFMACAALYFLSLAWYLRHPKPRVCDDCGKERLPGERPHEIVGCPEQSWPPRLKQYQAQALGRARRVIEKGPKRDCQVIDFVQIPNNLDDTTFRFMDRLRSMLLDGYKSRDEIEHKTIGSDPEADSCQGPCPRVPSPYDHERTIGRYRVRPGSDPEMD